jgi:hypothetical protein
MKVSVEPDSDVSLLIFNKRYMRELFSIFAGNFQPDAEVLFLCLSPLRTVQ